MNVPKILIEKGEKDRKSPSPRIQEKRIAICNDLVTGSMGEKVFWDFLLEGLSSAYGVDTRVVGKESFEKKAQEYIVRKYPETKIIIQNVSFIGTIDTAKYTIGFLQDNLRSMNNTSSQQERNLKKANKLVANSLQTALSYPEYDFEIIPIGVNEKLFHPMDKKKVRSKYGFKDEIIGIFVGNFSEVKGWSKIKECIKTFPSITWILVSKYRENFEAPNVRVYNQVPQDILAELYNCADFFIIGSPVETQCIAAIEASLCNTPLIMRNVGIFKDFTEDERNALGVFGDDFVSSVKRIGGGKYTPRKIILEKGLSVAGMIDRWTKLLNDVFQEIANKGRRNENQETMSIENKIAYLAQTALETAQVTLLTLKYKTRDRVVRKIKWISQKHYEKEL